MDEGNGPGTSTPIYDEMVPFDVTDFERMARYFAEHQTGRWTSQ